MSIGFHIDAESGEPHIFNHGVEEREVEDILASPGEDVQGEKVHELQLARLVTDVISGLSTSQTTIQDKFS